MFYMHAAKLKDLIFIWFFQQQQQKNNKMFQRIYWQQECCKQNHPPKTWFGCDLLSNLLKFDKMSLCYVSYTSFLDRLRVHNLSFE